MATDFFERQSAARRNTVWLIGMFLLATIGIVATTFLVAAVAASGVQTHNMALNGEPGPFPWQIPSFAAGGALALVGGGTLYKVAALRAGGGASVAEQLGGRRLYPNTEGLAERRLLNVVEEMALASGVPVPPVYLLDEPGINAFAAGFSPSDAVLGVTRGAIEQLTREQLQGVIAHEFSHLLNGDMRMGIRLIGILYGILLLGLAGQMLLRSAMYTTGRRDRDNGTLVILGVGVALVVLGFVGTFIGGLIKAAVSRQREYLADASAVQFTRNPQGIAGALKRIGALGSQLRAPAAGEASHLFFAQGVWEGFSGLMATHPPLRKRILAIEPDWDGTFPKVAPAAASSFEAASAAGFAGASALRQPSTAPPTDDVDLALVDNAVNQVGEPREQHRHYAAQLIDALPAAVRQAAREPYGARAVVYCLLLDPRAEVRSRQVESLRNHADPAVLQAASQLQPLVAKIDARARLPLVDLALPALRAMSASQFESFSQCVQALVAADERLGLFEWTLGRIIDRHLEPQFRRPRAVVTLYYGLQRLGGECSMLLSTIAHLGHSEDVAERAFETAAPLLPEVQLQWLPREACSLPKLQEALNTLTRATARLRGQVLDACAEVICADGQVKQAEAELLRGIADLLDCPVPPLIAGESVPLAPAFKGQQW